MENNFAVYEIIETSAHMFVYGTLRLVSIVKNYKDGVDFINKDRTRKEQKYTILPLY